MSVWRESLKKRKKKCLKKFVSLKNWKKSEDKEEKHLEEWLMLLSWQLCQTRVRWPEFPPTDNEVLKKKKVSVNKMQYGDKDEPKLIQTWLHLLTSQACHCQAWLGHWEP